MCPRGARKDLSSGQVTAQGRVEFLGTCGDLNGDGDVNVFDAIIDLQIVVGPIEATPGQMILGDVVPDGTINVFDAILVLQHIVGLTEITECGPPPPPTQTPVPTPTPPPP